MLAGFDGLRRCNDTDAIFPAAILSSFIPLNFYSEVSFYKCNKVYMKRCFKVETIIDSFLLV